MSLEDLLRNICIILYVTVLGPDGVPVSNVKHFLLYSFVNPWLILILVPPNHADQPTTYAVLSTDHRSSVQLQLCYQQGGHKAAASEHGGKAGGDNSCARTLGFPAFSLPRPG